LPQKIAFSQSFDRVTESENGRIRTETDRNGQSLTRNSLLSLVQIKKSTDQSGESRCDTPFFVLLFFRKKVNGANNRNRQGGRKPDEVLSRKRKQPTDSENCDWLSRQSAKRDISTKTTAKFYFASCF
jgi:hypothetical protein